MKVLVTGATGFLGSWVARELASRGHTVRALVRPTSSLANLEDLEVERAEGDVTDRPSVERALDGCNGVIHTAGIAHFRPGDTTGMFAVNVGGVEKVLGAALDAGIERAVLTSSVGALGGQSEPRIADETSVSNAEETGVDYLVSKYRGEVAGLAVARRGLHVAVMRPGVLLGPGDIYQSSATTFLAVARKQLPVYVTGGASFCDVRDVAAAHVTALERGGAGEVYLLAGHNLEISAVLELVGRITGVRPPRRVPYALAYAVAATVELGARAIGKTPDISRQLIKASSLFTYASSAKAEAALDYRIRPLDESMRDTFRFFLRVGRLKAVTAELRALAEGAT